MKITRPSSIPGPSGLRGAGPDENAIKDAFILLAHGRRGVTEVAARRPDGGGPALVGYFDDGQRLAKAISELPEQSNVFIGAQPRPRSLLKRSPNRLGFAGAASSAELQVVTNLVLDLEPDRPGDLASTMAEMKKAVDRADVVCAWFEKRGFFRPVRLLTGNGVQLWCALPPIALEGDESDEVEARLGAFEAELQRRFSGNGVSVVGCADLALMARMPGTLSITGEGSKERPWRMAKFLDAPERREDGALRAHLLAIEVEVRRSEPALLQVAGETSDYGRAALERETRRVALAPDGDRRALLKGAGFIVFQLVAGGEIDEAEADKALVDAASAAGLDEATARRVLEEARQGGLAWPRSAPESPPPAPVAPAPSPFTVPSVDGATDSEETQIDVGALASGPGVASLGSSAASTVALAYGAEALAADQARSLVSLARLPGWPATFAEGRTHPGHGWGESLDGMLGGGLEPGALVALSGNAPACGTTALVTQLGDGLALRTAEIVHGGRADEWGATLTPVVIVSELDARRLTRRTLARWLGVPHWTFRRLDPEDVAGQKRWTGAREALSRGTLARGRELQRLVPLARLHALPAIIDRWREELASEHGAPVCPVVVVDPLEGATHVAAADAVVAQLRDWTTRHEWIALVTSDCVAPTSTEARATTPFHGSQRLLHACDAALSLELDPSADSGEDAEGIPVRRVQVAVAKTRYALAEPPWPTYRWTHPFMRFEPGE